MCFYNFKNPQYYAKFELLVLEKYNVTLIVSILSSVN